MRALLAFLILVLFAGCDSFQAVPGGEAAAERDAASKQTIDFQAPANLTTVLYTAVNRTVSYAGKQQVTVFEDPNYVTYTAFSYNVTAGESNDFLYFKWPTGCDMLSKEGFYTNNTVKIEAPGKTAFTFQALARFAGSTSAVPLGEATLGFADNNTVETAQYLQIVGPSCTGFPTIDVTGFVFIDRVPNGAAEGNYQLDNGEPGVGNVAVQLLDEAGNVLATDYTDDNSIVGKFVFSVPDPSLYAAGAVPSYELRIASGAGGINTSLFDKVAGAYTAVLHAIDKTPSLYSTVVNLGTVVEGQYYATYPLALDVKGTYEKFLANDGSAETMGLPREYWRVQSTGKGSPKYKPDMSFETFSSLVNCTGAFPAPYDNGVLIDYKCIANRSSNGRLSFGDDQIDDLFTITGVNPDDRLAAVAILKTSNNNDANEGLRTEILTALLNFAAGRSIHIAGYDSETDEMVQKTIISNAMNVLLNDGCYGCANKIGEGSVGENTALLGEMNGG